MENKRMQRLAALESKLFQRAARPWASLPWIEWADEIDRQLADRMVMSVSAFEICNREAGLDVFYPAENEEAHLRRSLDFSCWYVSKRSMSFDDHDMEVHASQIAAKFDHVVRSYSSCILRVTAVCSVINEMTQCFSKLLYSAYHTEAEKEADQSISLLESFWANGFVLRGVGLDGRVQVMARPPLLGRPAKNKPAR